MGELVDRLNLFEQTALLLIALVKKANEMEKTLAELQASVAALTAKSAALEALFEQLLAYRTTNPPHIFTAIHDEIAKLHTLFDTKIAAANTALGVPPEPAPPPVEGAPV
jgi:hypothetical protein